jgi:hypothetical protein
MCVQTQRRVTEEQLKKRKGLGERIAKFRERFEA